MEQKKEYQRSEMVSWYDPFQLKDTAKRTIISTIIGENADPRLVASLASSRKVFDYSRELIYDENDFKTVDANPREEIWIDYVSDVGDGFDPTYAVALSLAKKNLALPEVTESLKRGDILVFGGDGVYPTPNPADYEKKLVAPYRMAFKAENPDQKSSESKTADLNTDPHVFALPGNHDWYDSLVAFQNVFCTHIFNQRKFARFWRTRQETSYFAIKLPHNWWLFGVDLQLSHNIDVRQLQYFEDVIRQMPAGDKIILCVPEPFWVKTIKYRGVTDVFEKKEESIELLENMFKKKEVEIKLYLAGDLHHYRRFEADDKSGIHKITAGGGGAFLHPTHDFDFEKHKGNPAENGKSTDFSLKTNYPSATDSKKQDWKNLYLFIWNNKTFGFLTAAIYIVLAFLVRGEISGVFTWKKAFTETFERLIEQPLALFVVVLLLFGLVFFTDSNSKIYRRTAGTIHGLLHLAAIFILGWLAFLTSASIASKYLSENSAYAGPLWFFSVLLICGVGGYFAGSIIMGIYLFVSLHFFGRHDNEAFSALKIKDYKNFLRIHINKAGKLTIYPVKIEKVPNGWTPVKEKNEVVSFKPDVEIKPELIEKIEPI